jgi:hypothetical protein
MFWIREGMTTKTSFTYNPTANLNQSRSFDVDEVLRETSAVFDFITVSNNLTVKGNTNTTNDGYTQPMSNLLIYKTYNTISSTEQITTTNMDKQFAPFFDTNYWKNTDPSNIEHDWKKASSPYGSVYDPLRKSCSFTNADGKKVQPFSPYFFNLMSKYSGSTSQMTAIKTMFYNIIRPVYLSYHLTTNYSDSVQKYVNSDGNATDSAFFIMNTCKDLVNKMNMSVFMPNSDQNGNVFVFETDSANAADPTFSIPFIQLFQSIGILLNVKNMIDVVNKNNPPLNTIQLTESSFLTGFKSYLDKINTTSVSSQLAYALQYPPLA